MLEAEAYGRWLGQERVTVAFVTTAVFDRVTEGAGWAWRGVETVLFGGQGRRMRSGGAGGVRGDGAGGRSGAVGAGVWSDGEHDVFDVAGSAWGGGGGRVG